MGSIPMGWGEGGEGLWGRLLQGSLAPNLPSSQASEQAFHSCVLGSCHRVRWELMPAPNSIPSACDCPSLARSSVACFRPWCLCTEALCLEDTRHALPSPLHLYCPPPASVKAGQWQSPLFMSLTLCLQWELPRPEAALWGPVMQVLVLSPRILAPGSSSCPFVLAPIAHLLPPLYYYGTSANWIKTLHLYFH